MSTTPLTLPLSSFPIGTAFLRRDGLVAFLNGMEDEQVTSFPFCLTTDWNNEFYHYPDGRSCCPDLPHLDITHTVQFTKEEILKETIDFYLTDPKRRASLPSRACSYLTDDGRKCAVGRCLKSGGLADLRLDCDEENPSVFSFAKHPDNYLLPQYCGYSIHFWSKLQRLHDSWPFKTTPSEILQNAILDDSTFDIEDFLKA